MRKKSNLKEIVMYIFTNWKIYFFAVVQVLLINDVLKNPCGVCALYLTNWSRLPGVLEALILYYGRKCHSICKKLKTDRLYSDNICNVEYVFLPCWSTRKESNFKLLPWEPHDNECCGKRLTELKHSLTSYTDERVPTLALIGRDYQPVLGLITS